MNRKISISIPKPCHENWQKMTTLEKGRFCDSCQKQVFDFTKSSDREILRKFNLEENICGRFLKTQLERDIVVPKEKSTFWITGVSGILGFLSLGNQVVFSQEVKTELTEKKNDSESIKKNNFPDSKINVSGFVYDEAKLPLPGAWVKIKGSDIDTTTDLEGKFSITVDKGDILEFYFIGYETQSQVIHSKNSTTIFMNVEMNGYYLGDVVIVRKTFFGRIFYSIGSIFR